VPPETPAPDPAAVPETEEADGATILDSPSDVSLAEADPAPERELDLGEPLPPGMLDTRRIEPETLE
jgi:hypothetical protein